jgi:hypothetical protein
MFRDGGWIFGVPAGVGSILFLLKFLLMVLGADHVLDTDVSMPHDVGLQTPHGVGDSDLHVGDKLGGKDVSASWRWVSFQGVIVMLMVGGWCGLALLREAHWGVWSSGAVAMVVGTGAMWAFGKAFDQMYKLQVSGNINISAAVGKVGEVYVGVPAAGLGTGQVLVVVDQRQRIYNARSRGGELARGAKVTIVGTGAANTLIVDTVP